MNENLASADTLAAPRFHPLHARVRWLLLARVLIASVFLGATALSQLGREAGSDLPLAAVAALIVIAYAFSIASAWTLPRIARVKEFAFFQVCVDILLISASIPLTGGLRSPMAVWYNLAIIAATTLTIRHGAFAAAVLSSVAYGVLMNLIYYDVLPAMLLFGARLPEAGLGIVYQIGANVASFFSIAWLSSLLVQRLARTEHVLEWTEESLQRLETLQEALIQNLESGVLTVNPDGRIESVSESAASILGRNVSDLIARDLPEILPVFRPPTGARRFAVPTAVPVELVYRRETADAPEPKTEERTLRFRSAPLSDTYQNPIGTLLILQDVTVLKDLERRAGEELEVPPAGVQPPSPRPIPGTIGQSRKIMEVARLIERVAPTQATVLLTGESGTGKELAAAAIHALSPRRQKHMVVVNCAAIPENLIESELFGHVRGSFTGAVADRRGLFRAADGGTIFLDEIGDLPPALQVKLLRVLQERSFTAVGGQTQIVVDVRVVAATNRNLEADVVSGRFREDLFYRLNVIHIDLPPLRERREDLPVLIQHFVSRFAEALRRPARKVSAGAMRRLLAHGYPGNIRELENIIEHSIALSSGEVIEESDLPLSLLNGATHSAPAPSGPPENELESMQVRGSNLDAELESVERRLIVEALRVAGGVRKRAAELLGIKYRSLRHRLGKYGFAEDRDVE